MKWFIDKQRFEEDGVTAELLRDGRESDSPWIWRVHKSSNRRLIASGNEPTRQKAETAIIELLNLE